MSDLPPPNPSAADKLLQTLLAFEARSERALSDLAATLNLPKSTVHRLLGKLKEYGLVEQDEYSALYRLGLRAWRLSLRARPYEAIRREVHPHLARLSESTKETAFLTVAEGIYSICIDRVEGRHNLRLSLEIGSVTPLHLGASNLVLLAFLTEQKRTVALNHWISEPSRRAQLRTELERIRQERFVFTTSQLTPGVSALAVPVLDSKGGFLAGLSIGGPAERLTANQAREFLPVLQRTATEVAERLDRSLDTSRVVPSAP